MKLIIEDPLGRRQVVPFVGEEMTIGRLHDNQVQLAEKDVSRRHGRLCRTPDGKFFIEDLRSFTGIRVNGERISGRRAVEEGDLIRISAYELSLEAGAGDERQAEAPVGPGQPAGIRPGDPPHLSAEARDPAGGIEERSLRAAEKPRLVGLSGPLRGKAWLIGRTPVTLGRGAANDVAIDHPSLGEVHCRLGRSGGAWKVVESAAGHALRVNGAPHAAGALRGGETLEIGEVRLVFLAPGQPFTLPPEGGEADGLLPQRMAPIRIVPPDAAARRRRLRLLGIAAAAVAAGVAVGASAARLLYRRRPTPAPSSSAPVPPAGDRSR